MQIFKIIVALFIVIIIILFVTPFNKQPQFNDTESPQFDSDEELSIKQNFYSMFNGSLPGPFNQLLFNKVVKELNNNQYNNQFNNQFDDVLIEDPPDEIMF